MQSRLLLGDARIDCACSTALAFEFFAGYARPIDWGVFTFSERCNVQPGVPRRSASPASDTSEFSQFCVICGSIDRQPLLMNLACAHATGTVLHPQNEPTDLPRESAARPFVLTPALRRSLPSLTFDAGQNRECSISGPQSRIHVPVILDHKLGLIVAVQHSEHSGRRGSISVSQARNNIAMAGYWSFQIEMAQPTRLMHTSAPRYWRDLRD